MKVDGHRALGGGEAGGAGINKEHYTEMIIGV